MRRVSIIALLVLFLVAAGSVQAQEMGLRRLVDNPTAVVLERGSYAFDAIVYPQGGVLAGIIVGVLDSFAFGFCYGGLGVIGSGTPDWNPDVEFRARLRLIEESFALPAIALGFDSQGFGCYADSTQRYQVKSKGFYAVASKHYAFLGVMGLHGGVNYSLEDGDGEDAINMFFGVEKSISPELFLLVEYDLALNDNEDNDMYGEGRGYLNAGLCWFFAERLRIQFDVRNLLENSEGDLREIGQWSRGIQINYLEYF